MTRAVRAVVAFARALGLIPIVGPYHWAVGNYGKRDVLLQFDAALAAAVFGELRASGLVPPGHYHEYLNDSVRWLSGESLEP